MSAPAASTVASTLARVVDLADVLAARSEEIERQRRVPADLLERLRDAGCFRMAVPDIHGGDDLALPDALRVIEAVSRGDAGVGWIVGQAFVAQVIFAHFPPAVAEEIYADGPDAIGAGAVAPKGRAQAVDGGWRVSGRWPFVSGCEHASWIYLQCIVVDRGVPRIAASGLPELLLTLLPAVAVTVEDTWRAIGMRGTGSHDVVVTRAHCPPEWTCPFAEARPQTPVAAARIPARDQGGLVVAASACGVAQAALDAVASLARSGKRPAFSPRRLAQSAVFQDRLGEAEMTLRAARALLFTEATAAADRAAADGDAPLVERARLRAVGPTVVTLATQVVDVAYALGGGSAVYDASPLQRHLRDARAATQHFSAGRDFYGVLGALLAGEDVELGLF